MRITIAIASQLVEAAGELAATMGITRDELFVIAIETYIKSQPQSQVTRALNEVYQTQSLALDPVLWQMQFASLPEDDW